MSRTLPPPTPATAATASTLTAALGAPETRKRSGVDNRQVLIQFPGSRLPAPGCPPPADRLLPRAPPPASRLPAPGSRRPLARRVPSCFCQQLRLLVAVATEWKADHARGARGEQCREVCRRLVTVAGEQGLPGVLLRHAVASQHPDLGVHIPSLAQGHGHLRRHLRPTTGAVGEFTDTRRQV